MNKFTHAKHEILNGVDPHSLLWNELVNYHKQVPTSTWKKLDEQLPSFESPLALENKESVFGPFNDANVGIYWSGSLRASSKEIHVDLNSVIDQIPVRDINIDSITRSTLIASKAVSVISLLESYSDGIRDFDPVVVEVDTYGNYMVMQGIQRWVAARGKKISAEYEFDCPVIWVVSENHCQIFEKSVPDATSDFDVEEHVELFSYPYIDHQLNKRLWRPVWRQKTKPNRTEDIMDHYSRQSLIADRLYNSLTEEELLGYYSDSGQYYYSAGSYAGGKLMGEDHANHDSVLYNVIKDYEKL